MRSHHINVALGLVIQDGKVLIVRRAKKETAESGVILEWGFPGGKVQLDETAEAAAVREVCEETGYHTHAVTYVSDRVHPDFPVRVAYILCELVAQEPDPVHDANTAEVRWIKSAELATYFTSPLDPNVQRVLFGATD